MIATGREDFSVIGRGKPLVIVNDREIKNWEELEAIRSIDIRSIEVDRNPSPPPKRSCGLKRRNA